MADYESKWVIKVNNWEKSLTLFGTELFIEEE